MNNPEFRGFTLAKKNAEAENARKAMRRKRVGRFRNGLFAVSLMVPVGGIGALRTNSSHSAEPAAAYATIARSEQTPTSSVPTTIFVGKESPTTTTSTSKPPETTSTTNNKVPIAPNRQAPASTTLDSTAYCLNGKMADGAETHDGAVAMNGVPFGTKVQVLTGPESGQTYTVEDRYGSGTQLDIWMLSCSEAINYGRQQVKILVRFQS